MFPVFSKSCFALKAFIFENRQRTEVILETKNGNIVFLYITNLCNLLSDVEVVPGGLRQELEQFMEDTYFNNYLMESPYLEA